VQQAAQHQASGARSNDSDLRAHILFPAEELGAPYKRPARPTQRDEMNGKTGAIDVFSDAKD
jgi:hypothetical protein